MRQISFLTGITDLVNNNSQFIISTHSPILMAYPNAKIFSINDNGVYEVEYEQTEHFKTTKEFYDEIKESFII
jgi:predicted ATPase